jgi:hypothetical protein
MNGHKFPNDIAVSDLQAADGRIFIGTEDLGPLADNAIGKQPIAASDLRFGADDDMGIQDGSIADNRLLLHDTVRTDDYPISNLSAGMHDGRGVNLFTHMLPKPPFSL